MIHRQKYARRNNHSSTYDSDPSMGSKSQTYASRNNLSSTYISEHSMVSVSYVVESEVVRAQISELEASPRDSVESFEMNDESEEIKGKVHPKLTLQMSTLERRMCIIILGEFSDYLAILGAPLPPTEPNFAFPDFKKRFSGPYYGPFLNKQDGKDDTIYNKLSKEMRTLEQLIQFIRSDLCQSGTSDSLSNYNFATKKVEEDELKLYEEYETYKEHQFITGSGCNVLLRSLEREISIEGNKIITSQKILNETELKVGNIMKFTEKRLKNAIDQNYLKTNIVAKENANKYKAIIQDKINEDRVHKTTMKFLNLSIKRYDDLYEKWRDKRNKDLDAYAIALQRITNNQLFQAQKMAQILAVYQMRNEEINKYLVKREIMLNKRAVEDNLNTAANKIQAWWRGCMVRCELGPYKRKKKKSSKKLK